MPTAITRPLGQESRPKCSIPLFDADLGLDNANWTKGLQAMSDWIWSGNLNPSAFPNHLARYFLQIPGIFEQQLNFSTTLIFDEPSFRNGVQVSGFIARPVRELVISLIAQRRHCWYSMTHHAVLGTLTAQKHGLSPRIFGEKLLRLLDHARYTDTFSPVEQEVLKFADAFCTNPKAYSDEDFNALRTALTEDNRRRYPTEGLWLAQLAAARTAHAEALLQGLTQADDHALCVRRAAEVDKEPSQKANERWFNAQLLELAFLCMQFVALSDVFTSLNIPDESFLPDVMVGLLQPAVIERLNELNGLSGQGMPDLVPPQVELPLQAILARKVSVEPCPKRGTRVPLESYELKMLEDRDKGLTVGGVQVGTYGWSFGYHFPGGLVYALMHHPELARFEAPYSLPLLFNEDEWRNGTQTAGFVSRRLKEIVYLKIYTTTRSRYGLEHHTMFLFNSFLDEHGVNRPPKPNFDQRQQDEARKRAVQRANDAVLFVQLPEDAPAGTFSPLELATMVWVERVLKTPHSAYEVEPALRGELDKENRREVAAGLRRLDMAPGIGEEAAYRRLLDHQLAELAMNTGHMDGLGRAMTMLRLESEEPVWAVQGKRGPQGGTIPTPSSQGTVQFTGYFNDRPGLLDVLKFLAGPEALTANELRLNPKLNAQVKEKLAQGGVPIKIAAAQAEQTAEF